MSHERKPLRRPRGRGPLGFSLAELVVVMAFASIMAGAALPRLSLLLASIRLPIGARQLAADLALARATAVLRNTNVRVTFAADAYTVRYEIGAPREVLGRLPAGVHVESLPASEAIRFYATGRADNGTVVLAGSSGARRSIVVNQRGRVVVR
jgi:Tfp pilus assembly protein FimT